MGALRRFWKDSRGATALEYGLILALIVVIMFAGISYLGGTTSGMWNKLETEVRNA
jgi:pilus assembly protein Flp/PilA